MWPNLKTKKLNNFTFSYNLVFKGKYINFGSKENTLTSTLENIL
jgi:penicillin-binding protein-related factor A (putative recombinase)